MLMKKKRPFCLLLFDRERHDDTLRTATTATAAATAIVAAMHSVGMRAKLQMAECYMTRVR
jgi:hypothetical protein